MRTRAINSQYHVTGQLKAKDMTEVAEAGFAAVICMRPDGEGFFQPKFTEIEAAAKAARLACYYVPVGGAHQPITQAPKLKKILNETEGPVLAFCASGGRCVGLYNLALQAG
ncbi:beta-lactamase hydrolase domain-containing protein [Martelella mediterranea]|uniref:beta-lactamase hydrolase domain-containing protein n=1 Tax=uncultured Martelella sp. TaxID=392331 RepID=UPI000D06DEF9|nr:sulfur transferase domain-containing protein [uncultured Martelella sp.]